MPVHDDLGVRMKTFYEQIPKAKLMRRCPVAIRIRKGVPYIHKRIP